MQANELMTGDWVLIKRTPSCEYPYKICSINNYSILGEDYADWIEVEAGEEINLEDIKPIPLTAEILKQNGFGEKTESNPFVYYLFKDSDNSVSLEHSYDTTDKEDYWACSIGNRLCDVCTISMHYIHELQHALRLCGIDKEIVL